MVLLLESHTEMFEDEMMWCLGLLQNKGWHSWREKNKISHELLKLDDGEMEVHSATLFSNLFEIHQNKVF